VGANDPGGVGQPPVTEAPFFPGPPTSSGPRSRRKWRVLGAIAVVVLLVVGYLIGGAIAAGASAASADRALTTTVGHQDTVGPTLTLDAFNGLDLSSPTVDLSAVKAALTKFDTQVPPALSLVRADRAALLQARPGSGSALTLPEQGLLNRDRQRVDAGLAALTSAETALTYDQQGSAFLHPFLDAIGGLEALTKSEQANDLPGALAQLASTDASLQKALALAKPPAVPQPLVTLVKELQTLVADLKGLLTAAQAHDLAGFQKWTAAGDADSKKVASFDQTAADNADKALYKPLGDSYNSQMKIAAGG
jgi:hypothetical protein